MKVREIKFRELFNGALEERADAALEEIAHNINDINADPRKKRSLIIKVEFMPNPDAVQECVTKLDIQTKLAGMPPSASMLWVGVNDDGEIVLHERHQDQQAANLLPFDAKEVNGDK